jgi:hypothetical protein
LIFRIRPNRPNVGESRQIAIRSIPSSVGVGIVKWIIFGDWYGVGIVIAFHSGAINGQAIRKGGIKARGRGGAISKISTAIDATWQIISCMTARAIAQICHVTEAVTSASGGSITLEDAEAGFYGFVPPDSGVGGQITKGDI